MERLKSITIIFLLAVGLLASAASAKPASVLLQEGLYAEEIEGDLDAAIKIYEQVIAEAKKVQRTAAQATYRIGVCYLKKGQEDKAAEYFQNIISNFPSQKALVAKAQNQLDKIKPKAEKIVEQAVMTISKCAEGDPRVAKALESLKGLDENVVVSELVKFLNSETDTVRRSAIYILWKGDLKDVSAAVPTLEKLCSHKEDITRGMAVISLGAARIKSSFETLANMTLEDPSGYARRCAAYALGLMGNAEAKPILEKALEDSDLLVRNNAKAALTMLEPPAVGGFGPAKLVSVSQLIKSGKVPAFKTQIYDNTGLDLETGVTAPLKDDGPALFDVVWDNDGGGALMINPESSVRLLALGAAEKWEDAISMARNTVAVLRTSTARGMFARQSKFVAVLTNEGNLAVVQIGRYGQEKAAIYWWIEKLPAHSFGPVKVVGLYDIDHPTTTEKECAIDFDTGKLSKIPPQARQMPGDDLMKWLSGSGIDAVAEIAGKNGGLIGIDVAVKTMPPYVWDKISPTELRSLVVNNNSARQETTPMLLEDQYQKVFVFRTRDSGLGILQILDVDKSKQMIQFRYKMLQERAKTVAVGWRNVFLPDADDVIQQGKVAVVLDLTTGKMLPGNKDKQYFNKLNKGDVAYFDDEGKDLLVCFRGAKITRKTANGKYYDTPDQSHTDNTVHIYIIKKTPAEWTITTKEGDIYELKVLSLDNNQAKIKYRKMFRYKMLQGETAQLSVSSHKVFLPECDTTVYDLLDLASNKIINSEPGGELIDLRDPAGKGNLYFDRSRGSDYLACVRGTRMQLRNGGELLLSEPNFISHGRNAYYPIVEIPCQYLVTTAQGDKYELKVLSVMTSEKPSIEIEYWKSSESPGTFAVATGVRGEAVKAMELLSGLKALMAGVVGAVESDDPNTALLLLDKLIAQSKQFESTVKGTSVEVAVKAGLEMLDPLRDALEKKQMGRAKPLLAALNQMGPAVESALEKEAAKQKIAAKHSRRLADTIAEMGWDLRTIEKAERGGDLRKSERFDKAEEMFKKALRKDPANASALKGLAVTYMERKDYDEAIRYYQMWLDAEPYNSDAKAGLEKAKAALKGK